MHLVSSSVVLSVGIEDAWKKLVYWKEWPTWDRGMESIVFDGPLALNSVGQLKLKNGPTVALVVTELTEGKSYTSEFQLLGTRYVFGHFLEPVEAGNSNPPSVKATVTADADGFTAPLFGMIMKSKLQKELPGWMQTFEKQLA